MIMKKFLFLFLSVLFPFTFLCQDIFYSTLDNNLVSWYPFCENAEDLMGEATNICDTMKTNPLFSSLMGMQGQLFSSMSQPPPSSFRPSNDVRNINLGNHSSEEARNRLQKKLQEKKMKVNKVEK